MRARSFTKQPQSAQRLRMCVAPRDRINPIAGRTTMIIVLSGMTQGLFRLFALDFYVLSFFLIKHAERNLVAAVPFVPQKLRNNVCSVQRACAPTSLSSQSL